MGYVGKVKDTAGNTHLVGSTLYGTCSTSSATSAKVVTCADFSELVTGVTIHVLFSDGSAELTNATMNVNSTGAKPLTSIVNGSTYNLDQIFSGEVKSFTYDGSRWVENGRHNKKLNLVGLYVGEEILTAQEGSGYIEVTAGTNVTLTPTHPSPETGDYPALQIASTDTKNTAGSSSSNSKLYLVGATSQAANAQTYSNSSVYEQSGKLYSNSKQVVTLSDTQDLTNKTYNSYTLGAACEKGVDSTITAGSSSGNLPTTAAVAAFVASQAAGSATFQGTLGTGTATSTHWTEASLEASSYKKGWYWVIDAAGTFVGETCEIGDMVFCVSDKGASYSAADFAVVQNNMDMTPITEAQINAICV